MPHKKVLHFVTLLTSYLGIHKVSWTAYTILVELCKQVYVLYKICSYSKHAYKNFTAVCTAYVRVAM